MKKKLITFKWNIDLCQAQPPPSSEQMRVISVVQSRRLIRKSVDILFMVKEA